MSSNAQTLPGFAVAHASELTLDPQKKKDEAWLDEYEEFIELLTTDDTARPREFQGDAIRAALRFLKPGNYESVDDLAKEVWDRPERGELRDYYGNLQTLTTHSSFPGKRAATLDLATAAGKSFVMYGALRISLNEGWFRRGLVLCPSLTIETGLREKFMRLHTRTELTDALPLRPDGIRVPNLLVDANTTISDGDICVENVHSTYTGTGSSLQASFAAGGGADTFVINDEAHHVWNNDKELNNNHKAKGSTLWHNFCADPDRDFGAILGMSGTCYHPRTEFKYFADVLYRYAIRDAITDGFAKEVDYVDDVIGTLDPDKFVLFEALWKRHEDTKKLLAETGIRPLALVVTYTQSEAHKLADQFIRWATRTKKTDIADRTIVVTSKASDKEGRDRLASVDRPDATVEFIVSVSMLTEGWDAKNVFTILPAEERAFDSELLIAQVLGRGLRIPAGVDAPEGGWKVTVLNHKTWAKAVQQLVDDVIERSSTIAVVPVTGQDIVPHMVFDFVKEERFPERVSCEVATGLPNPDLLLDGIVPLLKQNPDSIDEWQLADPLGRRERSRLSVNSGSNDTWVDVAVLASRIRATLRTEHRDDTVMTDLLKKNLDDDLLAGLIHRSLEAAGCSGQKVLSSENAVRVLAYCSKEMFPSQGQLFAEQVLIRVEKQVCQISTAELHDSQRRLTELAGENIRVHFSNASRAAHAANRPGEEANLAAAIDGGALTPDVIPEAQYKSPTNMVVVSYRPERQFLSTVLFDPQVAGQVAGWVKNPDSGFWQIRYELLAGADIGEERGFNPDFLILEPVGRLEGSNSHVYVVETKADGEDDHKTIAKIAAAEVYVERLNELLTERQPDRPRYSFHVLTPNDYTEFKARLLAGTAHTFVGAVHQKLSVGGPSAQAS